jgi:hypothetical protein
VCDTVGRPLVAPAGRIALARGATEVDACRLRTTSVGRACARFFVRAALRTTSPPERGALEPEPGAGACTGSAVEVPAAGCATGGAGAATEGTATGAEAEAACDAGAAGAAAVLDAAGAAGSVTAGAGTGAGAGAGAGAGTLPSAARGGRYASGSTYPCAWAAIRMPRWTYGAATSGVPLGPTVPTSSPSATVAPLPIASEPRCVSVTAKPSGVSMVRLSPDEGTAPAKPTVPDAGARTSAPASPPMSMPRCSPAA